MNLREAGDGTCGECGWVISADETEIVLIATATGDFWRYHQGCAAGAYFKALAGEHWSPYLVCPVRPAAEKN